MRVNVFCFFVDFYSFAQEDFVQGLFKLDSDANFYIKKEGDVNSPLAIYLENNGKSSKVKSYEVDGGAPHVETLFSTKMHNKI